MASAWEDCGEPRGGEGGGEGEGEGGGEGGVQREGRGRGREEGRGGVQREGGIERWLTILWASSIRIHDIGSSMSGVIFSTLWVSFSQPPLLNQSHHWLCTTCIVCTHSWHRLT